MTAIRPKKWLKVYKAIGNAFHGSWELIIVSPERLPLQLLDKPNIQFIQDWGCPTRCQQIALTKAQGEYVAWTVDDGVYLPKTLDKHLALLTDKKFISLKYTEGTHSSMDMALDKYYIINYHSGALNIFVNPEFKLLNFGIGKTSILKELGGWDCQFETLAFSQLDLAIRLQMAGYEVQISNGLCLICEWMPGIQGDHAPMHHSQIEHDEPIYREIYSKESCKERIYIPLNNWQNSPEKWIRRFK